MRLEFVDYDASFLDRLVVLWREAFEFGVGVEDPHPVSEQCDYFLAQVLPKSRVTLALVESRLVGFVAASDDTVLQLHVQVGLHRQGIGSALLALSKTRSHGRLWLHAFTQNVGACRFYEKHGFVAVQRGFEPVWQLEDIKYSWSSSSEHRSLFNDQRDLMQLVWPALEHVTSYRSALLQGWSADTRPQAAAEELAKLDANPQEFLAGLVVRDPHGETVVLPDGSKVARLPGYRRWLWDGEFCGSISFRWQSGTHALPPHCLGHVGYAVVPWKRRQGYATRALALLLPEARAEGLSYVEITTDPDNMPSQRVIEANGGVLFEHFVKPAQFGSVPGLRYRVPL